jgi:SAM-dependent methyltransferase
LPVYELSHCIVCGHTDADVVARQDDVRAEVEALWEFHQRRLRVGTPSDRLMDRVAFSEHPPFRLVSCTSCGLIYRNPTERQHELAEIYARKAPAPDSLRSLHETQLSAVRGQATELRRVMGRGGSVLEVGSYVGAFLAAAKGEGLSAEGVDINPEVNRFTRSLGFAVHDGQLDAAAFDHAFDALAIWNTFDQLPDPRGTLSQAAALVRPDGVLALRVPNGDFYREARRRLVSGNRVARAAARQALAQNNLLGFPYRWGFTPRALHTLLDEAGFTVVRVRGDVLVPIADEWTRSWARVEEIGVKAAMRVVARRRPLTAPWIELYAQRRSG